MSEENKWEEEFEKEYEADKGFWENLPNKKDIAKHFYLQARKVEKEEIKRLKEIISTQDDYVKLLTEELDELAIFASVHGWKSTRYGQGKKLREKIIQLKEEAK